LRSAPGRPVRRRRGRAKQDLPWKCLRGSRRARRGPHHGDRAAKGHTPRWGGYPAPRGAHPREIRGTRRGCMNLMNFMNLEGFSFPGFDPVTGAVTLPWWAAAAVAALLVASWILALLRGGPAILVGSFVGVAFLALAATVVWVGGERVTERERIAERERAEERRGVSARARGLAGGGALPAPRLARFRNTAGGTGAA